MNKKGNSILMIVIIIALIGAIGALGYFMYSKNSNEVQNEQINDEQLIMENEEDMNEFEMLQEDENTPEEIDNETLNDLDKMMKEIDKTSEVISDLNY